MSRDLLRSLTVGKKAHFRSKIVEIEGAKFEVRAPSIKVRAAIIEAAGVKPDASAKDRSSKINTAELQVLSVIYLVHHPETGERVFDMADRDVLMDTPAGGFVDVLAEACMEILNIKNEGEEAPGKNSEETESENSSSV